MVHAEHEYMEYLLRGGLQDNSAYSYGRYLNAVSRELSVEIGPSTVTSDDAVSSLIERLSETGFAQRYKNNCATALRRYRQFLLETELEFVSPDEIESPETYPEGTKKTITVNAYERNSDARNKCLEIHGLNCSVCEMNFEDVYGPTGTGYIHVHHTKPLHEIDETYAVNPETDLVPVCPNCHAMLHRPEKCMEIDELRDIYLEKKLLRDGK